jgi:flagellar export protein FliJ
MTFHFPLQAVLHFREGIEHQQELRLRTANQRVARARHLLEQVQQLRLQVRSEQSKELGAGTTAAELRFGLQREAELERQIRELEQQVAALEQAREQQRKIFQQAKRARETLESVRERQFHEYRKQRLRREQRNMDDLYLMRQKFLRRG